MKVTDIYACIEAERARKGITIEEFAKKIGICDKSYRNWKNGGRPIPSDVLIKIAKLFDCSTDYLLGLSDKIKR
jgi:transcriptional regulator with XRE-family HTH domain